MNCTRCQETGFLNIEQVPEAISDGGIESILKWMGETNIEHDVAICDCCGDGDDWHGEPGEHYGLNDPQGHRGPYASNGGLCRCH